MNGKSLVASGAAATALMLAGVSAATGPSATQTEPFRGDILLQSPVRVVFSSTEKKSSKLFRDDWEKPESTLTTTLAQRHNEPFRFECEIGSQKRICYPISDSALGFADRFPPRDPSHTGGAEYLKAQVARGTGKSRRELHDDFQGRPGWAPVDLVEGGDKVLGTWIRHAESGGPINCKTTKASIADACAKLSGQTEAQRECRAGTCNVVMRFAGQRGISGAAEYPTLRLCESHQIENLLLPPHRCTIVASWDGQRVWMPAWLSVGPPSISIHVPEIQRAGAVASVDYRMKLKKVTLKDALRAVRESLRSLFSVVQALGDDVVGISQKGRVSAILVGFREWGTVRVIPEVYYVRSSAGEIDLAVWITMLVSKTNTDDPREWRPLTESEQQRYNEAVRRPLAKAIDSLCPGKWNGDYEYECLVHN